MINRKFNYDLETLYVGVNGLVKQYKTEGLSLVQKNFIIGDLLNLTHELVMNNCKRFIRKYTITDLTEEDLYAVAIGEPLLDALDWFDFTKGNNFMVTWHSFMVKRFCNELKEISSKKASFFRNNVSSADKILGDAESESTILDIVGEEDFSGAVCGRLSLSELIRHFEEVDKHGKVIRCLAIKSQAIRTEALMKVLGSSTYGNKERKQVQRAKERFAQLLLTYGYDSHVA